MSKNDTKKVKVCALREATNNFTITKKGDFSVINQVDYTKKTSDCCMNSSPNNTNKRKKEKVNRKSTNGKRVCVRSTNSYNTKIIDLLDMIRRYDLKDKEIFDSISRTVQEIKNILMEINKESLWSLLSIEKATGSDVIPIMEIQGFFIDYLNRLNKMRKEFLFERILSEEVDLLFKKTQMEIIYLKTFIFQRLTNEIQHHPLNRKELTISEKGREEKRKPLFLKYFFESNDCKSFNFEDVDNNTLRITIFPLNGGHSIKSKTLTIGHHTFALSVLPSNENQVSNLSCISVENYNGCRCIKNISIQPKRKTDTVFNFSYREHLKDKCEYHNTLVSKIFLVGVTFNVSEKVFTISSTFSSCPTFVVHKDDLPCRNIADYIHPSFFPTVLLSKRNDILLENSPIYMLNIIYKTFFSIQSQKQGSHNLLPVSTVILHMVDLIESAKNLNYQESVNVFFSSMLNVALLIENNKTFKKLWTSGYLWFYHEMCLYREKEVKSPRTGFFSIYVSLTETKLSFYSEVTRTVDLYRGNIQELSKTNVFTLISEKISTNPRTSSLSKMDDVVLINRCSDPLEYQIKQIKDSFRPGFGLNEAKIKDYFKSTTHFSLGDLGVFF